MSTCLAVVMGMLTTGVSARSSALTRSAQFAAGQLRVLAVAPPGGDFTLTVDGSTPYNAATMQAIVNQVNVGGRISDTAKRLIRQYPLGAAGDDTSVWVDFDGRLSLTSDDTGLSLTVPAAEVQTAASWWQSLLATGIGVVVGYLIRGLCLTATGGIDVLCTPVGGFVGGLTQGIITQAFDHSFGDAVQWAITLGKALLSAVGGYAWEKWAKDFFKKTLGPWLNSVGAWISLQARTAWTFLGAVLTGAISSAADLVSSIGQALPGVLDSLSTDGRPSNVSCDVYAWDGEPCAAAYSTIRALYSSYNGPLYQVQRASDGAAADIGLLAAGGYADASQQDSFCAGTSCTISRIYDQSGNWNDLTVEGAGGAGGADHAADAAALPVTAGGHSVYGVKVTGVVGYRDNNTNGIAVNGQPEGMYMVASGTYVNAGCCFDFGNAETNTRDNGNGHMDAVNLSTACGFPPCTGGGPWVQADLENGLFLGGNGNNTANAGNNSTFVTALLKNNGTTTYALKGGDAQGGGLSTWYDGPLPTIGGYRPMQQEGAIVLGTGGDNSNASIGSFFEGVMTQGYPSDAADNAAQANIVSVGYAGSSGGTAPAAATVTTPGGKCLDVYGDDNGGNLAPVDIWDCQPGARDQHWTHNADGSLETLGRCLDIDGNSTAVGAKLELYDCNGVGGQKWYQEPDGALFNPQSGQCLDDPSGNTTNGTVLQIYFCNGESPQGFMVNGGNPVVGPGGKCVDVIGDDNGGNTSPVDVWDCQPDAADQHWVLTGAGQLQTLGKCLDIDGNGTAPGTKVELYDCNGVGGQVWRQQADGSLVNPQSGLCLDDPSGNTTNGTVLQIWTCNNNPAQQFLVYKARFYPPAGVVTVAGNVGKCVDVYGDDNGANTTAVDVWDCQPWAADQHWIHNPDGSLEALGRCLDIDGNGTAPGTKVELYDCNGVGGQKWMQEPDGALFNPQSGQCLDDPSGNTGNGTVLQIWYCNGNPAQLFNLTGGATVTGSGGQCLDVLGDDTGGNNSPVDIWGCQPYAVDQHWVLTGGGQLKTMGRCLDIDGNGTAPGTRVELYDCNGVGGQVWRQQAGGSLVNPQSGLCLDDPSGNTGNGTVLQIWTCNGLPAQRFRVYDAGFYPPAGVVTLPGGQCLDVAGNDNGGSGAPVDVWDCQPWAADQHWTHNPDGSLATLGRCLDIAGDGTAVGTKVVLNDCGGGHALAERWVQQANGSLLNPASDLCLDDPSGNTANGTQLQIYTCNNLSPQVFHVTAGSPVTALNNGSGPTKCVDVLGDDTGGNGTPVDLWDCQGYANDQHWTVNADGTLRALGRCLDIDGNGTASGTKVELYDCDGAGGQQWQQLGDGVLKNPQSGLCLDDPGGNTTNGTVLQVYTCNGGNNQVFVIGN